MSSRKHSSKQDRHSSSGSRSYRSKESASSKSKSSRTSQTSTSQTSFSFLFVVNDLNYQLPDGEEPRDTYSHRLPPGDPRSYGTETLSRVMRYSDGVVREARGYMWMLDGADSSHRTLYSCFPLGRQSQPYISSDYGDYREVPEYKRAAVFACNPLLPIMVCPMDPMVNDTTSQWELLNVFHPRHLPGVTQVAFEDSPLDPGPGLARYAAGSDAAWMPTLLPETYKWPLEGRPSRGLGGELSIILGLMALSEAPGNTNNVFLGVNGHRGMWHRNTWAHRRHPRGYPNAALDEQPRGVLAAVFLDPENPLGSTEESMESFEWDQVVVEG